MSSYPTSYIEGTPLIDWLRANQGYWRQLNTDPEMGYWKFEEDQHSYMPVFYYGWYRTGRRNYEMADLTEMWKKTVSMRDNPLNWVKVTNPTFPQIVIDPLDPNNPLIVWISMR